MKKIISIALSTILVLSAVFTVPMVFADDNEPTTKIVNTFEEEGFGTKPDGTTSTLKNNALVASDTYIKSWTTASSIVAQLEQVYKPSAEKAAGIKIYNPYDANFAAFVPEKNAYYKITFDYYYASKSADIELSIYGNTTDDGFKDTKLTSAAYIGKNNASIIASTKKTATVYVNIGDTEYKSLSIVAELANHTNDTEDFWGRIDNITLEKLDAGVIENTYESFGFGTKPDGTTSTLKNNALVASDTYIKSWTTASSIVAQLEQVYKPSAEKAAGVKIYNPYDANFAAFVPEKNTTYKITFDYYYASKSADIELSIYGNTTDDGFKDTKLTSAAYIGKNNASIIASTKKTATVYVNIGDTEYKSLSIVAELANHTDDTADFWGRIDNIVLTKSEPECQHENEKDGKITEATYFTKGSKEILCADCDEFIRNDEIPCNTTAPVTFDKAVLNPETNKLTVTWTYSKALNEDIKAAATKGLAVKFAFGEKVYTVPNTILTKDGGSIVIEGVNADRFNTTLKVNLEFTIGEYTTTALNEVAEYSVAVNTTVDSENAKAEAYTKLIEEIGKVDEAVVAGVGTDNDDFTAGASKIDIKTGTAEIKFVATETLIDTLLKNGNKDKRTVKLVVTIGDESHDVTLNELRSNITVKISGLSFDQMYGSISAKLVIDYAEETGKADITTEAVTFDFVDGVNNSDLAAAAALEALLKK